MINTPELKECPFCGASDAHLDVSRAPEWVSCYICKANAPYDLWNYALRKSDVEALLTACELARDLIDDMMGDSDLDEDEDPALYVMQQLSAAITKAAT